MRPIDRRTFLAASAAAVATPALSQTGSEDAKLRATLDRYFDTLVDDSPEFATSLGLDTGVRKGLRAKLDDRSQAAKDRRLERTRAWVKELKAIDRAKLTPPARTDLDVVLYQYERGLEAGERWKFGNTGGNFSPYVVSQRTGAYQSIPDFMDSRHRVANAADAEAYLARLRAFAVAMDQDLARLNADAAQGVTPPDFACDLAIAQMNALRKQPATQTVMVTSILGKAKAANLAADYASQARRIVEGEVFPALDRQIAAMQALRAKATSDAGVWKLPNGDAYYADCVKASTTTNYSPDEVHRMGLDQVAEITGRIDVILKGQGMTQGSVAQRLMALNNDPKQLYADSDAGRAEMIADLNAQVAEIYKLAPQVFGVLPKAKVEVRRVPVFIQDGASNGYYQGAALDGSRPAAFYINLKAVEDWPRYNLPTLTYHETLPGHHQQIALQQESERLPMLRRAGFGFSAFSEGWGLYAEQLADELGAYEKDPLGRAGYLQSLLFRAARLVTDTGIHAKRWSREQATQYMVDTIGNTKTRAQREVERYCVSPGQANSYKVGHTVWVKVREDAKKTLGAKFDLKAFHDHALLSGAVPLTVLERNMAEWAQSRA